MTIKPRLGTFGLENGANRGPMPRKDMNNRDFVLAVMGDCLELAHWAGLQHGPGLVIADRRPEDSYLLRFVPADIFIKNAQEQHRQKVFEWLADLIPDQPEMGFVMLLVDAQGAEHLLRIVPPRSACRSSLLM